jgi:hypothetical protein
MKKMVFVLLVVLVSSCSSDSSSPSFTTSIAANGIEFKPTKAKIADATANIAGEDALSFTLEKGTINTANYESIVFKINYPLTSSSAPNGIYDFGIGVIGETLFAQGSYYKGNKIYSLAGYTVKVTALEGYHNYKLEFQNIQAVNPLDSSVIIISGVFEGKVTS